MCPAKDIPGYTLGDRSLTTSPVSTEDFSRMKQSVLMTDDDLAALRQSHAILKQRTDEILDVWYGFVGSLPHLLASFSHPQSGAPDAAYLAAVRARFGQWILDTAQANYDQAWLNYQHEIGLRHHRMKKNRTDGASASPIVPFRDLFLLVYPVTFTLRPFLGANGIASEEVDRMHAAWVKSCLLQVTLWSHPYIVAGDF